ncbi:hypothetical protein Taro_044571 [Colocasia esculenta]|uniref:EF-hand domain-containing protein n=1 Tax=Colocasia esculenta TaxID=4460 RepID=A0A843WM99_COLES|nr:hypothetical protein [Colocasia esculenta]
MEFVPLDALFMSYLLVALLGLLLDYPVLVAWAQGVQKLNTRCLSFLVSRSRLFAVEALRSWPEDLEYSGAIKEISSLNRNEEDHRLSARDLEIVMERMSSLRSCDDRWRTKDAMVSVNELSSIFDEQEPSLEEVMEAFCMFDRNGDGFISAEELHRVLSSLGFSEWPTLDVCGQMISAYDENRDGRIDAHEFVKLMERCFC